MARRGPKQRLQSLRKVPAIHLCETGEHRVSEAEEKARGRLAGVVAGLEGLTVGHELAGKSLDLVIGPGEEQAWDLGPFRVPGGASGWLVIPATDTSNSGIGAG